MAESESVAAVDRGPQAWWKRLLATLGLLTFSVLFSLVLGEVAIRIVAPQQLPNVRPDIWQPDDSVGWVGRPNVNTMINTGERSVHVYTDTAGFRIGKGARPQGDLRILLIGDSFMQALQVEYEQSLAGLLEAKLPARLGRPVIVDNAGTDGWDAPQYLIRGRTLLARRDYSMVLVSVYVGNDAVNRRFDRIPARVHAEETRFHLPRAVSWGEFVDGFLHPLNDRLKHHSHLFIFIKTRMSTLAMRMGLTGTDFPEEILKNRRDSPRWNITADILGDLAAAAAAKGVPTYFMLVPAPYEMNARTLQEFSSGFRLNSDSIDVDQPTTQLYRSLSAKGLRVFDALPGFLKADSAGVQTHGHVDRHLTPAGHEVLEHLVEDSVVSILQARRPAQKP